MNTFSNLIQNVSFFVLKWPYFSNHKIHFSKSLFVLTVTLFLFNFLAEGHCNSYGEQLIRTATSDAVPLHRYFNTKNGDHFYTTNYNELGGGKGDYRYEGVAGKCFAFPTTGTVPFYRYYNGGNGDHFYTTNISELGGGRSGYNFEGIQCYVYPQSIDGTLPFYRYYNSKSGDHFYTTNFGELGGGTGGYKFENVAAYIVPAHN